MIIRNNRPDRTGKLKILVLALVVGAVGLLAYFVVSSRKAAWQKGAVVSLDMETVQEADGRKQFVGKNGMFAHGQTQTKGVSRSGSHSCEVFDTQPFGATWESDQVEPGDVFECRVWRKSLGQNGALVADGNWGFYGQASPSGNKEGDWEELVIKISIPVFVADPVIKFYVWNDTPKHAFFDDLSIRKLQSSLKRNRGFAQADSVPSINLIVSDKGMQRIKDARDRALKKGLLQATDEDWVKVKLEEGKLQYTGQMRLKGDWTDHLLGDKWSFRIALDEGQAWRRMVTFSVQNPNTRYFLAEWLYHQWLDKEDILTPRYSFVEVKINGVSKGLYAYEEHFEKQIAEYNNRREGPIMKYDEEGMWEAQDMIIQNDGLMVEDRIATFKSSDILPFGAAKARKDSAMRRQVEIAQQLILQYKTGQKNVWDIFDGKKVARYYAIVDVTGAQHGFIWHNQRWYYNPVISRMEPIGFDGYTSTGPFKWINRPFIGYARNIRYMASGYRELMFEHFFHDREFVKWYIHYLFQYTDPAYLEDFFLDVMPQLDVYEGWIQKEWPLYSYDRQDLFNSAKAIRMLLMPIKHASVKANYQGLGNGLHRYKVFNWHCLPVVLEGVGKNADKIDEPFTEDLMLDAYANQFPAEYLDVYSKAKGNFIFFSVPGIDSIFSTDIQPWLAPEGKTPEQELFEDLKIQSNELYTVIDSNKRVLFKSGKYKTSKDILIPKGYQVWFEKGVEIDFVQRAKFISKSQVLMFGTEEEPINITSSDKSANGFTILQAEGKSEFHYAVFDNLNTMSQKGWNLTGAVSVYESEILIDHSRFVNNHCEDALNLVRCIFDFTHSYVGYTYGDGFDADFCHGVLTKANFSHTGNDGMDFSGSHITINSAYVENAGDKGISLGEECTVTIHDATVVNSVIGIAAKDLTQVTIDHIVLKGNEQAFAAYQKKPEYGPASITVKSYEAEGNKQLYVLQKDSKLKLVDELIIGKK